MSYILNASSQSQHAQQITAPPAISSVHLMSSSQQSHSQLSLHHKTNSLAVNNESVPAASNGVFLGANISSISECHFQIFNGPLKLTNKGKSGVCYRERRRILIFIASVTEILTSSPNVFKTQSQTGPILP